MGHTCLCVRHPVNKVIVVTCGDNLQWPIARLMMRLQFQRMAAPLYVKLAIHPWFFCCRIARTCKLARTRSSTLSINAYAYVDRHVQLFGCLPCPSMADAPTPTSTSSHTLKQALCLATRPKASWRGSSSCGKCASSPLANAQPPARARSRTTAPGPRQ